MKHCKGCLAAALAALLACGAAGTASASVGTVTRELEYRDIKVTLDGELLDLRDAAGGTVEPFMFGGTNYLPVRALAEALGLDVAWDGAHATVALTTPEAGETEGRTEWVEDTGTLGESTVTIKGARLAQDDTGEPAIVITYAWTNHSDQRTYSFSSVAERAYQAGVELSYAHIADLSVYDPETSLLEVRPGVTVDVQAAYVLNSLTVPVEFELTEMLMFSKGDRVVYHDYDPQSLEGGAAALNPIGAGQRPRI